MEDDKICLGFREVVEAINAACDRCHRSVDEVTLMAVTKTQGAELIDRVCRAGARVVGENRVQEAAQKRPQVHEMVRWELIGPLQSNKVKQAVATFDRIQTVDRIALVAKLDRAAGEAGRVPYPVLMQVNVGKDPAKHGCAEEEAAALMEAVLSSKNLCLEGLMTIGQMSEQERVQRATFAGLRKLRDRLESGFKYPLPVLSMGMTADLAIAIEEGSTLLRIGTAIFGAR